ncbi:hypothetical protein LGP01_06460, partial [Escherichia coli]|uniref:hypothetical protein n=1 Tax=Escherichia coli TaxID=562 RepID=UPI001CF154AE
IGPDPRNFNQRVSLGRNDLLIRTFLSDVLVEITMFDDPDWPFSESILVITTASPEEVQSWFVEEIAPDECWEGWSEDTEHGWVEVPVGMHPVTCWWD